MVSPVLKPRLAHAQAVELASVALTLGAAVLFNALDAPVATANTTMSGG